MVAKTGTAVDLTIAGAESEEVTDWAFARPRVNGLTINRLGSRGHQNILALYESHDIFCLPTRHPSEGHSNAINEAMMMGMVIVTTRHGFIPTILDDSSCYFVDKESAESLSHAICQIAADREGARVKSVAAREILQKRFSSDQVIPVLERVYQRLVH